MSAPAYWDANLQPGSPAECSAQGEESLGALRAWIISTTALACDNELPGNGGPWGGRITGVDVYFTGRTDEKEALAAITTLLPADASQTQAVAGNNPDYSSVTDGSCKQVEFSSASLANLIRQANPSWAGPPDKAVAVFYSGHATASDGAGKRYTPGSVGEAILTIGGVNVGADGNVHC